MTTDESATQSEDGLIVRLPDMTPSVTELDVENSCDGKDRAERVLYYWDYLGLDLILNAQHPKSAESGRAVHDEFFFIVVHQTYELWFKQILIELDTVREIFAGETVDDRDLNVAVSRLGRISAIQRLLNSQSNQSPPSIQ